MTLNLIKPNFVPPLDDEYRPAVLANRQFQKEVAESGQGVPLAIALERADGSVSRFETAIFPDDHPQAEANLPYAERLVKFLLWQRGGWKVYIGGSPKVGDYISRVYAPNGERSFDFHFMGEKVYEYEFTVVSWYRARFQMCRRPMKPDSRWGDTWMATALVLILAPLTARCRRWLMARPFLARKWSGSLANKPIPNIITMKL
jgi:hypothetical protein